MAKWPWPDGQVAWFLARARRAADTNPRREELAWKLLSRLASDLPGGPVQNLSAWTKRLSLVNLRELLESTDAPAVRALAEREAGMPRRRGDIVRIRTLPSWWDLRER